MYNPQSYYQNYGFPTQPQTSGINWVQGEAAAKSYALGQNQSVLLMDSEDNVFYIKSTDNSGIPRPLRIFDYKERITTPKEEVVSKPKEDYITREEFEKRLMEITNAKQRISTVQSKQ